MAQKIVIDPVTRIEGHLRITAVVEDGKVTDAWATTTQFRGFEIFMKGRDPRDIWHYVSRICGVCPTPHGIAGAMATEHAMGVDKVPDSARLVRNMLEAAQTAYDHILWFYMLNAFDYVNVPDALNAKPKGAYLKTVQGRVKALVESGQLGPFANGYWDHPAYKLPSDLNLELTAHYLQAIDIQQKAVDALAHLGGKFPMVMNLAPGGVTQLPSEDEVLFYHGRMQEVQDFIDTVMLPDLLAVAPYYKDHATFGQGVGNFLTWGILDAESQDPYDRLFPRGAIFDGDLTKVHKVDPKDAKMFTKYSWFEEGAGKGKHPLDVGQEKIEFTKLPATDGDGPVSGKYSWTQAVRYGNEGRPMEVGPLAQMVVAYVSGRPDAKTLVDTTLKAIGAEGKPEVLVSALGRIAGRVLKAKMNIDHAVDWSNALLANIKGGKTAVFTNKEVPATGEGYAGWDAPRGALSHYVRIDGGKIKDYAAIPATNWNVAPRDDKGIRGPIEEALVGTPVHDPEQPLEILRVVHTFDP